MKATDVMAAMEERRPWLKEKAAAMLKAHPQLTAMQAVEMAKVKHCQPNITILDKNTGLYRIAPNPDYLDKP